MADNKEENISTSSTKSLVFISHDTRDAKLAEEFSLLLKKVSAGVLKSFWSSDKKGNQGIEYGVEWYPEIIKNIQSATDVVCLLTPNSVNRPWVLFEAGVAKGKLDTPILGIALGLSLKKASSGPFAQFQNCGGGEDDLCKLVFQLVNKIPNSEPDKDTIKIHVQNFITTVEKIFSEQKENSETDNIEEDSENNPSKLFEEIKVMFQDLPSRIDSKINRDDRIKMKRRFHPMMIEELIQMTPNKTVGILMALSLIKEKLPWLYEMGNETIKIIRSDATKKEKMEAVNEFEKIADMSTHNSLMEEFMMNDSKDDYMLFREIPRMIQKNMHRLLMKD